MLAIQVYPSEPNSQSRVSFVQVIVMHNDRQWIANQLQIPAFSLANIPFTTKKKKIFHEQH